MSETVRRWIPNRGESGRAGRVPDYDKCGSFLGVAAVVV